MPEQTAYDFFAERGFELRFHADGGYVWADVQSLSNPNFVHPRYGRGTDERNAATSAAERWRVEQAA